MKNLICGLAVTATIFFSTNAFAQLNQGYTTEQMVSAINGMSLNGGSLSLERITTDDGGAFYMGKMPGTLLEFAVWGIDCSENQVCSGMEVAYVMSSDPGVVAFNSFNEDASYVRGFSDGDAGWIVLSSVVRGPVPQVTLHTNMYRFLDGMVELQKQVGSIAMSAPKGPIAAALVAAGIDPMATEIEGLSVLEHLHSSETTQPNQKVSLEEVFKKQRSKSRKSATQE